MTSRTQIMPSTSMKDTVHDTDGFNNTDMTLSMTPIASITLTIPTAAIQ